MKPMRRTLAIFHIVFANTSIVGLQIFSHPLEVRLVEVTLYCTHSISARGNLIQDSNNQLKSVFSEDFKTLNYIQKLACLCVAGGGGGDERLSCISHEVLLLYLTPLHLYVGEVAWGTQMRLNGEFKG